MAPAAWVQDLVKREAVVARWSRVLRKLSTIERLLDVQPRKFPRGSHWEFKDRCNKLLHSEDWDRAYGLPKRRNV